MPIRRAARSPATAASSTIRRRARSPAGGGRRRRGSAAGSTTVTVVATSWQREAGRSSSSSTRRRRSRPATDRATFAGTRRRRASRRPGRRATAGPCRAQRRWTQCSIANASPRAESANHFRRPRQPTFRTAAWSPQVARHSSSRTVRCGCGAFRGWAPRRHRPAVSMRRSCFSRRRRSSGRCAPATGGSHEPRRSRRCDR